MVITPRMKKNKMLSYDIDYIRQNFQNKDLKKTLASQLSP